MQDSSSPVFNRREGEPRYRTYCHNRGGRPNESRKELEEHVRRLERRLAEEVAIAEVQQRLLTCVDVEQVAGVLLEVAPELTAAERCRLAVCRSDGEWRCWDWAPGGQLQRYDLGREATFPDEVIGGKRGLPIREWSADRGPLMEFATRLAMRSYMAMPVISAGRLVGILELANFVHPEGIDEYSEVMADLLVPAGAAIEVALLNEEARQQAEELSKLLRNLEDFTHAVSHDLRTPLTIVIGHVQLAERSLAIDRKDAAMQSLAAVLSGTRRMNSMIEDMVDIARMEAGTIQLSRQQLDLVEFTAELRERMAGVLDVGRVEIVEPRKPLPGVWADPDRLERILTNLLTNALKYSDERVTVSFEARDGEVVTSVADCGVGIAQEDIPHLFERYYRAKGTRQTEGLGLGLFITRMLVEAHGGRIWAESKPGDGATFHFTLPLASAAGG